jgi:hypothetical protein
MWAGMFQAFAVRGNTVSVRSTRDAISDMVATYAISDEQGAGQGSLSTNRESKIKGGPFPFLAIHPDPSSVSLHNHFTDR